MSRYWPCLLFFSALAVRLIGLGSESLWYDEAFSAHLASLPLDRLMAATAGDVHPPLWYLIEWLTVRGLGASEFSLRLPAALASAAGAAEMFLLVRRIESERAGLVAAGLMIASGGMHYYGQEARMYSLMTWLSLFGLRSLLEDRTRRFVPAMALLMYTQNLAAFVAAPLGLLALWRWRSKAIKPLALAGLAYLPWGGVLAGQLADVSNGFWIPRDNLGGLFYFMSYGTFGTRLPGWAMLHGAAASVGLTAGSVWTLRRDLYKYVPLLMLAFVPALSLFGVSEFWRPLMLPRALLPASAGVISLWSISLVKMSKQARMVSLSALVPMLALAMINPLLEPDVRRFPIDSQRDVITKHWQPGDAIYNVNLSTAITYGYYLPPDQYPSFIVPQANDLSQSLSESTKRVMGLKDREASVEQLVAAGYQRLFVLWVETPVISDREIAEANRILDSYPILDDWLIVDKGLAKLTIYLVDISGGGYGMVQPRGD